MEARDSNGWTNYETWCVAVWIDNERESSEKWRQIARQYLEEWQQRFRSMHPPLEEEYSQETAAWNLGNRLRNEFEEHVPDACTGVYSDLLGAALWNVNWQEIAAKLVEEAVSDQEFERDE